MYKFRFVCEGFVGVTRLFSALPVSLLFASRKFLYRINPILVHSTRSDPPIAVQANRNISFN